MALKPISKIAAGVQASTTLAIDSLFKQMKAEGKDVVGFGAGEPDFPTPEHIKQAGIEAIENNQTKYTPAAGLMDLRKAACYRLKEDCGLDYEPTQIVVASGAKHSVYIALMTLCNPGDEVVIAAPYWVSYSEMVKQAGAIPVIVAATEEADFKITAEQLGRRHHRQDQGVHAELSVQPDRHGLHQAPSWRRSLRFAAATTSTLSRMRFTATSYTITMSSYRSLRWART